MAKAWSEVVVQLTPTVLIMAIAESQLCKHRFPSGMRILLENTLIRVFGSEY